jgi:hypothetical protein
MRTNGSADYLTQVLPGVVVFALGLAATVAPLTATVLGSVEPGHSGLASGVNNAVARVASLLAIAALGAVVSGTFRSHIDDAIASGHYTGPARTALVRSVDRPLITTPNVPLPQFEQTRVHAELVNASVHAFRIGMGISAALVVLGGVVALVGIVNPRREVRCADCPGGALAAGNGAALQVREAEPAGASASA